VVDDKEENRYLLLQWLQTVGFHLKEATNGQEAVSIWEQWEPHLIWMDMRMPVMDGYEATRSIKSTIKGQATVIIALTASAFEHERDIVLSAGCDDFVRKPVRESTIFDKITEHLGVQFIYEEWQPARVEPDEQVELTPSTLAMLPSDWVESLRQAAEEIDLEAANATIERIRERNPSLADSLSDLVVNYRFDKLQLLTQQTTEKL
jgi:CheY-like chemotaxis protein